MAGALPTADDFFSDTPPPVPVPAQGGALPTADEFFAAPSVPEISVEASREADKRMRNAVRQSTSHILNAFGYGAAEGFGREPIATPATSLSPEFTKRLKALGIFNDYAKGQVAFGRATLQGAVGTAAAAAELANRGVEAVFGAVGGAVAQTLTEAGVPDVEGLLSDPTIAAAYPELSSLADMVNARRAANLRGEFAGERGGGGGGGGGRSSVAADIHTDLSSARASGTIAEGPAGFHDVVPPSPENMAAREAAAREAGTTVPEPLPPPKDIHELARRIDPEAFDAYDAKVAEISQIKTETPEAIAEVTKAKTELADMLPEVDSATQQAREMAPELPEDAAVVQNAGEVFPGDSVPAVGGAQAPSFEGKTYYHGTSKEFESFAANPNGIYFAAEPGGWPALMAGEKGRIIPARVDLKNPLEVKVGSSIERAFDQLSEKNDGIVIRNENGGIDQVIALKPEQIAIEKQASAQAAPANPTPPSTRAPLRAVEGTGAVRTLGVSESVEAKAIEAGLTDSFGDLPEYYQVSKADQAERVVKYMNEDYESAKAIARGEKAPPKDILLVSMFEGVKQRAIADGDLELVHELATGRVAKIGKTMGQNIAMFAERNPGDPIAAVQRVQAAREADLIARGRTAGNTGSAIEALVGKRNPVGETVSEIKTAMRKGASTRQDWGSFIEALRCK